MMQSGTTACAARHSDAMQASPLLRPPRHCLKKLASGTNNQQYLCTRKPTDLD